MTNEECQALLEKNKSFIALIGAELAKSGRAITTENIQIVMEEIIAYEAQLAEDIKNKTPRGRAMTQRIADDIWEEVNGVQS